jgi:hypothetical protein
MRLWSIHPSLLDSRGLIALWQEALRAQKGLRGKTKGYRHHPQLQRFQQCSNSLGAICAYLWAIQDEATRRGCAFDASRIAGARRPIAIGVSNGQLAFERKHLHEKLHRRDAQQWRTLRRMRELPAHPMFTVHAGGVERWEKRTNAVSKAVYRNA